MVATPLRPPGACEEKEFVARCIHCGQCVQICPHKSLQLREGFVRARHTPQVDPKVMPCHLCMKCPPVCPSGALDPTVTTIAQTRMGYAHILKDRCHNYTGGIMCWTCYDRCPLRGIAIILEGGVTPAVTQNCVGCGICEYVCPVKAVKTLPHHASVPATAVPVLEAKKGDSK